MDGATVHTSIMSAAVFRINLPMDEQPRAPGKFRVFLDGDWIPQGDLTITFSPRIGMFCTLYGQAVRILEVVYDEPSGEIDEIYLEKALE